MYWEIVDYHTIRNTDGKAHLFLVGFTSGSLLVEFIIFLWVAVMADGSLFYCKGIVYRNGDVGNVNVQFKFWLVKFHKHVYYYHISLGTRSRRKSKCKLHVR